MRRSELPAEAGVNPALRIQLLQVPDCPLVEGVRTVLQACLAETAITAVIERREGSYPSPTLVIDGLDVVTGLPPQGGACCRLDLPTRSQIVAALGASTS